MPEPPEQSHRPDKGVASWSRTCLPHQRAFKLELFCNTVLPRPPINPAESVRATRLIARLDEYNNRPEHHSTRRSQTHGPTQRPHGPCASGTTFTFTTPTAAACRRSPGYSTSTVMLRYRSPAPRAISNNATTPKSWTDPWDTTGRRSASPDQTSRGPGV